MNSKPEKGRVLFAICLFAPVGPLLIARQPAGQGLKGQGVAPGPANFRNRPETAFQNRSSVI